MKIENKENSLKNIHFFFLSLQLLEMNRDWNPIQFVVNMRRNPTRPKFTNSSQKNFTLFFLIKIEMQFWKHIYLLGIKYIFHLIYFEIFFYFLLESK